MEGIVTVGACRANLTLSPRVRESGVMCGNNDGNIQPDYARGGCMSEVSDNRYKRRAVRGLRRKSPNRTEVKSPLLYRVHTVVIVCHPVLLVLRPPSLSVEYFRCLVVCFAGFAIILWEMATMTKPFEALGREEFFREVVRHAYMVTCTYECGHLHVEDGEESGGCSFRVDDFPATQVAAVTGWCN